MKHWRQDIFRTNRGLGWYAYVRHSPPMSWYMLIKYIHYIKSGNRSPVETIDLFEAGCVRQGKISVYSGADQRKHQSSASLAFVWRIHRWPVNSPHKGAVTRKMFPFDDIIMQTTRASHFMQDANFHFVMLGKLNCIWHQSDMCMYWQQFAIKKA